MPGQWARLSPKRIWRAYLLVVFLFAILYTSGFLSFRGKSSTAVYDRANAVKEMCKKFPDDGTISVSIKTGATEQKKKLSAILDTSLSCVKDVMVFSDLNQTFNGIEIHDVLSRFTPGAMVGNQDFNIYRDQLKLQAQNREDEIETMLAQKPAYVFHWHTFGHTAAWALDKYKFIHMLEMAYELQPGRDWYLFVEPDTYLSWPNLKRWLRTLDPTKKLYLGNAIQKSDERPPLYFAHGGSGFVISGPALKEFAVDRRGIANRLDFRMHEWWAGDFTVADAFYDEMGLEVTTAAPMFNQFHSLSLPFWEASWCEPAISLHHMQAEDFNDTFRLEHSLHFSRMLLRDVYSAIYTDKFPTKWLNWDNLADTHEFALDGNAKVPFEDADAVYIVDPNADFDSCRIACEYNERCFQFTWRNMTQFVKSSYYEHRHSCVLSSVFRLGHPKSFQDFNENLEEMQVHRAWHSGWLPDRIASFVQEHWECPEGEDHWMTNGRKVDPGAPNP